MATIPESIKNGHRRCKCNGLKFKIEKVSIQRHKRYSNNIFKDILMTMTLGPKYGIPHTRYKAICSQCGKLYFASETKKQLIDNIKISGIEVSDD